MFLGLLGVSRLGHGLNSLAPIPFTHLSTCALAHLNTEYEAEQTTAPQLPHVSQSGISDHSA